MSGVALAQVNLELMTLKAANQYLPKYADLDPQVVEQAKLMYLNYPNNPTGAVATPDFYAETVKFAQDHHIGVVQDFAYGALGFDGNAQSASSRPQGPRTSVSKCTLYPNPSTWLVGESGLRRGMPT